MSRSALAPTPVAVDSPVAGSASLEMAVVDYLPDWLDHATAAVDHSALELMRMTEALFRQSETYSRELAALAFPPMKLAAAWHPVPGLVSLLELQLHLVRQAQLLWQGVLPPHGPQPASAD